jgi:hypothetical protein
MRDFIHEITGTKNNASQRRHSFSKITRTLAKEVQLVCGKPPGRENVPIHEIVEVAARLSCERSNAISDAPKSVVSDMSDLHR